MSRRRPSGRALIRLGIVLSGVTVVLIGTIGALQDSSQSSIGCEGMGSCSATNGAFPTGWGWWVVIGVAVTGGVAIVTGVTVNVVRRHESRTTTRSEPARNVREK